MRPRAEPALDAAAALAALAEVVGPDHVLHDAALTPYASDIFNTAKPPLALAAPATVAELQALVQLAGRFGLVLVPRGGGASYTAGTLADTGRALLVDLRRLDRVVAVNEQDAWVTVQAGITWAALDAALAPRGWRTPFRGPFSGSVATVGGAMAQHAISHGSGGFGMSADSVLSLAVVLADGSLLHTGSAAVTGQPFLRHAGPDLSGLFLGSCGALGTIATITLPLRRRAPAFAGASFGFDSFDALHAGMQAAARAAVDDTHFALDAAMVGGALARPRSLADTLRIARRVAASAPHAGAALAALWRLAWAGERGLKRWPYLAHYGVEAGDGAELRAKCRQLQAAMRGHGHRLPATVPTVVHSQPFERMFHLLGPAGERWVPLHGLLPHSRVRACQAALQAWRDQHGDDLQRRGVWLGSLFECVGAGAFSLELCLYWPDGLNAYHRMALGPATLARRPAQPDDPALRDWVGAQRQTLIRLLQDHGAVQMQIGRTYGHAPRLDAVAAAQLRALKRQLDPAGRMNPGVLGLW